MVKILVADDSSFMRKIVINLLKKLGYEEIAEANNGEEAVVKYQADKPDLVLMDIVMEKKDGIAALKEIMAADSSANVIMVSAVGQEQMVTEAKSLGAKDFITKPFDNAKVEEAVKKALG